MIWKRYFFREILKYFFFFLGGFFLIFTLIEYSFHIESFMNKDSPHFYKIIDYYWSQFLKRFDFLAPLAFLIATIKVLTSLLQRNEWLILQSSGLSTKKLLSPFVFLGICNVMLSIINSQYFLPSAAQKIESFQYNHFGGKASLGKSSSLSLLLLKDGSKLFYHGFDPNHSMYFNVIWVKNLNDLWKIKRLEIKDSIIQGKWVEHLQKNGSGLFEKSDSYSEYLFPDLLEDIKDRPSWDISAYERSFSQIITILSNPLTTICDKNQMETALYFKIHTSLAYLLFVLAVSPFCISYQRYQTLIAIYTLSILGFFVHYMVIDSLSIVSEQGFGSPFFILGIPFICLDLFICWRFFQKTS